jgi:hypothetical protein
MVVGGCIPTATVLIHAIACNLRLHRPDALIQLCAVVAPQHPGQGEITIEVKRTRHRSS